MSANTFTGSSPASTRHQILHIGTGVLAAGCVVRLGDGTAVPFSFTTTGISSPSVGIGSTNITTLLTDATAARSVTLADTSGKLYPAASKVLSATVITETATTNTSALTDLSFTPDAGGLYDFEACFLVQSNNTAVGLTLKLSGPTMDTIMATAQIFSVAGAITGTGQLATLADGTPGTLLATTATTAANTTYLVMVKGFYKVGATTGPLVPTLTAEVNTAATNVSCLANSYITHTRRA